MGQRSLVSYSPLCCKETDTTNQLTLISSKCISLSFYFCLWLHQVEYGLLVPWPGMEHTLPAVEAWSPNHCTTTEVP